MARAGQQQGGHHPDSLKETAKFAKMFFSGVQVRLRLA